MTKKAIKHPDATRVYPFPSAVECDGWLYVSGQGPLDLTDHSVVRGTIQEETRLTLEHIDKILVAAGCTRDDVVKCTCHLLDLNDFAGFNEAYIEFFSNGKQDIKPARTTVQSVLLQNIKVEIDAIARMPSR